jgi:hypothetical protein
MAFLNIVARRAEKRDARAMRDPKFDIRDPKFRTPRTSDLEPSLVPPVSRGAHPD